MKAENHLSDNGAYRLNRLNKRSWLPVEERALLLDLLDGLDFLFFDG